jgi:hypothetical protein
MEMGYDITLLIGKEGHTGSEIKEGDLIIENGEAYRPYIKDEEGNFVTTGKKETFFFVYAELDLCKCDYDGFIHKLDRKNTDESHHWYWYRGSEKRTDDFYGDQPKPMPIAEVIEAIEKDSEGEEYRRFKWALALLNSMKDDPENLQVLWFGH